MSTPHEILSSIPDHMLVKALVEIHGAVSDQSLSTAQAAGKVQRTMGHLMATPPTPPPTAIDFLHEAIAASLDARRDLLAATSTRRDARGRAEKATAKVAMAQANDRWRDTCEEARRMLSNVLSGL